MSAMTRCYWTTRFATPEACGDRKGVDAQVEVWMGMPHGFPASIGKLKAAAQALLDAVGVFPQ